MPAAAPCNPTADAELDRLVEELAAGERGAVHGGFAARAALARACLPLVDRHAERWARISAASKGLPADRPEVAEEWLSGPLVVARHLRALAKTCDALAEGRLPRLQLGATRGGARHVLATPRDGFDRLVLPGYRAEVEIDAGPIQAAPVLGGRGVLAVLGAGNVTSMPVGDALHAIFLQGAAALVKLSPLHAGLRDVFADALRPLLDAGLLRLLVGDGALGSRVVAHVGIGAWHLTGAPATLQSVLAVPAARSKPWTAELGNVTPVLLVPGPWRDRDLRVAAAHLADLLADNGGRNCVTPRLLVTCREWPQRGAFLGHLQQAIAALPPRSPGQPDAQARFERFAGHPAPAGDLPFVLRAGVDLDESPEFGHEESFAPVLAETAIAAADPERYLAAAVAFVHDRTTGALAAHVVAPPSLLQRHRPAVDRAVAALRHGTVGVNCWAGLGYGLVAPPWGAGRQAQRCPGSHWPGRGFTHNTLCLRAPRKTIVSGPFGPLLLPPWRRRGGRVAMATALTRLHTQPRLGRLFRYYLAALLR